MSKLIKISINISGMIGFKEMFDDRALKGYEVTKPIRRSHAGDAKTKSAFNVFETLMSLPEYTIRQISFITCYNSHYIGSTSLDDIPSIAEANERKYLGVQQFIDDCKHIVIVLDLRNGFNSQNDFKMDTYNDGFLGALMQGGPDQMNTFADHVIARYANSLTPEALIALEGVRKDFATFVIQRNGNFSPQEKDVIAFLNKHELPKGWASKIQGGNYYYNLADRMGLLTMDEKSFQEWILETSQRSAARLVAVNLLRSIEFETGTALYDVGYIASEGIAYEIMGYLCALLLV